MNDTFATRLKGLRKNANLTQIELAKIFNIANGTVGNWESGNRQPDYAMLQKIADFFNVSIDYLIGGYKGENMNLKKLRLEKGLNQEDVAKYLGVTQQAYANYERGARQPDYAMLQKIADFFNVSIDYLIDDSIDTEAISHARQTVKRLLEEQNYPIAEIEEKLDVSYLTLRSWCNGYGDYFNEATRLSKVAELLNVSVGYLLGEEPDNKKEKPIEYDGLSEKHKALIDFALSVPEDKAEMLLRVMKSIVEGE